MMFSIATTKNAENCSVTDIIRYVHVMHLKEWESANKVISGTDTMAIHPRKKRERIIDRSPMNHLRTYHLLDLQIRQRQNPVSCRLCSPWVYRETWWVRTESLPIAKSVAWRRPLVLLRIWLASKLPWCRRRKLLYRMPYWMLCGPVSCCCALLCSDVTVCSAASAFQKSSTRIFSSCMIEWIVQPL